MKHHEQHARLAFNEQRALDDLQRLHREIQRARSDRERAETDFDQFVRGFRSGAAAPAPIAPRVRDPQLREPIAAGPLPIESRAPAPDNTASAQVPASPAENAAVAERPPGRGVRRLIVPVTVAAVIVGVFAARARKSTAPADGRPAPPVAATSAAAPPGTAPAPDTPAPAVKPGSAVNTAQESGVNVELRTTRPVWLRVFVDGRRAIEREVGAGQRLPLRGERTVVIRAGDAGAVSVVVNGRDQGKLGLDGAVATRAFSADAR